MEYVLITGASSGIGKTFAEEYAASGSNLVLVARSHDKLGTLAARLQNNHGVDIQIFSQDLSLPDSAEKIFAFCNSHRFPVRTLINNAGFGCDSAFDSMPLEKIERMIVLHTLTLVKLTRLFISSMKERKNGQIVNVSSILAFAGVPYNAVYAATKSFVLSFSESIREELKGSGISVLALCPGLTETDIYHNTGIDPHSTFLPVGSSKQVVQDAIRALESKKPYTIPGFLNKLIIHTGRLLPRSLLLKTGMVLGRRTKSKINRTSERQTE